MRLAWMLAWGGIAVLGTPLVWAQGGPPSLLDQPPAPPQIEYAGDLLTIHAANSSLRAILDSLQTRTGASVQGLSKDERIFGVYGPGKPQDVLAALLDDSGYNVLIAGRRPDGAPREIVLSAKQSPPAGAVPTAPTQAASDDDDSDGAEPPPQPAPMFGQINQANPGAGTPAAPQPQIRTPQQMLEELQRLRQMQTPPQ